MNKSYQKFLAATVSAVVVASAVAPIVPFNVLSAKAAAKDFSDVKKGAYYHEAVVNLSQRGVINGFNDGSFKPDQEVTRSQAVAIIAASLGLKGESSKNPGFKDVKENAWYYHALAALVEKGVISGVTKDQFMPNKAVTRAEMAKMLSLAYDFKATTTKSKFTDVQGSKWYAGYVGSLVENNVTSGVTSTTFAPGKTVTRGQMASFVFRAENQVAKVSVIEKVTNETVTISGKSYTVAESLKSILNADNEAALKNAGVKLVEENGVIQKLTYLELKTSGNANAELVFDAKGGVVQGNVKVSADYISLKNLTVKGNFELAKEVQNSFYSDKLSVEGKTIISGETAKTASITTASDKFYQTLRTKGSSSVFTKATVVFSSLVFENANLGEVEVNKNDVRVEPRGATKVGDIVINANATISASEGIVIPKLTLKEGAQQVEINANIQELTVSSKKELTLTGSAKIDSVKIKETGLVNLNTTGEIKQIESTNKDAKLTIKEGTKIGNITLPQGVKVSDIISNYDKVKENIQKVGGETNPEATPTATPTPAPSAGGGGGENSGDQTPPTEPATYGFDLTGVAPSYEKGTLLAQAPTGATPEVFARLTPVRVKIEELTAGTAFDGKVRIAPVGASNVQLWAKDSVGNWYDINQVGWGPAEGFDINLDAETEVYVLVGEGAGSTVTLTFHLVEVGNETNVVATETETVNVVDVSQAEPATYGFDLTGIAPGYEKGTLLTQAPTGATPEVFAGLTPVRVKIEELTAGTAFDGKVRIAPVGASNVQLWAKDSVGNWYDINQVGWGPAEGFDINLDAETEVYVLVGEGAGSTATLTFHLVEVGNETNVVATETETVNVVEVSQAEPATYGFDLTGIAPSYEKGTLLAQAPTGTKPEVFAGLTPVRVKIEELTAGTAFDGRVRIAPVGASNVQLWAKDSVGNWYDINQVGWGPAEGFDINLDAETEVYVLVGEDAGSTITLTFHLVEVGNETNVVATETETVNVVDALQAN